MAAPTPTGPITSSRPRGGSLRIVAIIGVLGLGALGIYAATSRKPDPKLGGEPGLPSITPLRSNCGNRLFLEWGPQMRCGDEAPVWSYDPAGKRCLEPLLKVEPLRDELEQLRKSGASGFGNLPIGFQIILYNGGNKILDSDGKELLPRTTLFVSYRRGSNERDGGMRLNDGRPVFLSRAGYWCDESSKVISPAAHKP